MEKEFEFAPKDWVLVRDDKKYKWELAQYSHYDDTEPMYKHCLSGRGCAVYCIAYEGNERLLGKTDDYVEPRQPKNGDFIYVKSRNGHPNNELVFIYHYADTDGRIYSHAEICLVGAIFNSLEILSDNENFLIWKNDIQDLRPATEEEKQRLLSSLHKIGKDWDADKKCIEDFYEPKDGDFVYAASEESKHLFIYAKKEKALIWGYCELLDGELSRFSLDGGIETIIFESFVTEIRPSTEEEKQLLLSKLHENGKDWDAKKKEIVDYKWEPERTEEYHYCAFNDELNGFEVETTKNWELEADKNRIKSGNCYKEWTDCSDRCDKLNQSLKNK